MGANCYWTLECLRCSKNVNKCRDKRCCQPRSDDFTPERPEQSRKNGLGCVLEASLRSLEAQEGGWGGLTCHYCAHQQKDAEEYVSRQRAEAVHDLPLGDGEENSEHLPTLKQSGPEPLGILTGHAARPYLRRTVEEPRGGSLRLRVGQLHRKLEAERQVPRHEEPGHAGARDRGE